MLKLNRTLPLILNQQDTNTCGDFAVAGVANYLLGGDKVDALLLHEKIGKQSQSFAQIFNYAMNEGLPLKDGEHKKIAKYSRILPMNPHGLTKILDQTPLVFAMQISNGKDFSQLIDEKTFIMEYPYFGHAMIMVDYDPEKRFFRCANSWGDKWVDGGYFNLRYMFVNKFITEFYSFSF